MPKAILEFNLPEDNTEYMYAVKGAQAHFVIDDFYTQLKSHAKHGMSEKTSDEWRDIFLECIRDYGISLYGDY